MAAVSDRQPDNAAGKYYIDSSCDFCEVCIDEAPNNIKKSGVGEYSIVFKQPENEAEVQELLNAMDTCPSESIGDDGDS